MVRQQFFWVSWAYQDESVCHTRPPVPYPSEESLSVWGSAPSCGAEASSGLVLCGAWVCVCTGEAEAVGLEVDAMVAAVCPEAIPGTGRQAPTVTEASE